MTGHLIFLDSIALIIFFDKNKLWSSLSWKIFVSLSFVLISSEELRPRQDTVLLSQFYRLVFSQRTEIMEKLKDETHPKNVYPDKDESHFPSVNQTECFYSTCSVFSLYTVLELHNLGSWYWSPTIYHSKSSGDTWSRNFHSSAFVNVTLYDRRIFHDVKQQLKGVFQRSFFLLYLFTLFLIYFTLLFFPYVLYFTLP